jgi:transposase-like protein
MEGRVVRRYSECFKRQVVSELEKGRFATLKEARQHYEIPGGSTIQRWLRRYGKNHLLGKVVRVERPNEADRIREFQRRVAQLEQSLGRTQAESLLQAEYLEQACQELGVEVEAFKKNVSGRRSTGSQKPRG